MGIPLNTAYLMLMESARKPYSGKVLQLGKQTILFPYEGLKNLANHLNLSLPGGNGAETTGRWMTDIEFFQTLGFSEVVSMEYGTTEHADYVWDLNDPVPPEFHEKFDAIFDGGTCEHVFNVPIFLSNVCSMLKIDGRVIHENPASGLLDHGFYSIQPTLYYDFYPAQDFAINALCVSKMDKDLRYTHTGIQVPYTPGMYDFENTWALEPRSYATFCVATKQSKFTKMVTPQQSIWARQANKN